MRDLLFFRVGELGVDARVFVAGLVAARTVPVAENADADGEKHVWNNDRQDQVLQIVVPRVPCDYNLVEGATVVAGEGCHSDIFVAKNLLFFKGMIKKALTNVHTHIFSQKLCNSHPGWGTRNLLC